MVLSAAPKVFVGQGCLCTAAGETVSSPSTWRLASSQLESQPSEVNKHVWQSRLVGLAAVFVSSSISSKSWARLD
ncbi:hypothetical protein RB213_014099, partial [Colletotrichum asianum]